MPTAPPLLFVSSPESTQQMPADGQNVLRIIAVRQDCFDYPKSGLNTSLVKRPQKVGQVKHYPVIERVRYCTGLFPFNRDLILLLL